MSARNNASELNREFRPNAEDIAEITPKWEAAATKLAELDTEG